MVDIHRVVHASDDTRFEQANRMGHSLYITSTSFSPDETKFLTSSEDGSIHVRRTADCMLLREHWLEHPSSVTNAVWGKDGSCIYYSLEDDSILYSSSEGRLYDTKQLSQSSEIRAIKPYETGVFERIALVIWHNSVAHRGHEVIVVSTEGVLLRGPYYIEQWYIGNISISRGGLLAYHCQRHDGIMLLDIECSGPTQKFAMFSYVKNLGLRMLICPGGSRLILV